MNKATQIIIAFVFSLVFLLSPLSAAVVSAGDGGPSASRDAVCEGVRLTGGSCDADPNDPDSSADSQVSRIIQAVINLFSLVVGVTAVIMIIVGGFRYVISMGDSSNVNSAKNTILYAIIGLVIVALAQVIVQFVLGRL